MATSAAYIDHDEASAPATPAAGKVRIYAKTDGLLYQKDDAGAETLVAGGAGLSNPMTTAEDIIVGGASGTPARVAVGTEGQVLTVSSGSVAWAAAAASGGIDSGTSFPGTPATHDLYFHETYDLLFFYDGTRWLTVNEYVHTLGFTTNSGVTATDMFYVPLPPHLDVFVERFIGTTFVTPTNTGAAYWTFTLSKISPANAKTTLGSFDTSADGTSWAPHADDVDEVVDVSAHPVMVVQASKTGAPSNNYGGFSVFYRLIGA